MGKKGKRIWELFTTFFKIGAFTFGGGYAMIPIIQREVAEKRKWVSDQDILDVVAIAESTPGPIAINSATFVGYKVAGFWGAFGATLGVVLPSFGIILLISSVLRRFQDLPVVQYAFQGIRAGVLALLIKALISMYKQCPKSGFSYVLMGASFLAVAFLRIPVLPVILLCGISGILFSHFAARRASK